LKENIGDFGEALKDFADKTSGIKSYLTYGAVETAKGLVTIFNMIDETGGWESLKNGTKTESLSGIAETAGQLGKAVNEFYDSVKNIKADVNVDSAVSVLTSLVDAYSVIASMSGTVTETSGMVTTSVTYNGLEKLGDFMLTLVPLGNALMQFSKSIGNMNVSNSRGAAETLKCIGEAVNQIKDVDFSNIGGRVEEFGARYNSFANKCSEVDSAVIDAFVENLAKVRDGINSFTTNIDLSKLETLPETFKNLGTSIGDSLSSGISDQSDKCSNAMSSVLRQVAAAGVKSLNEYKSLGRSMMTYLARGISDGQSTVENAVRSATANASSVISSDGFYRAGIMCVKGFANGLSDPDSRYSVVQAATSMAKDAVNAVETTTQVSSPAKVFIRIGEYCSEGMAIGITNLSGMVSTAAGDMAGSAIDTATMALDSMSTAVYGLDGLTPTVSPVLDVTDLRLGAMSVNSMFSDSSAVKFAATISADMKTQNDAMADLLDSIQNGIDSSNSRVIDAVNGVASTISEQQSEFSLYLDTNKFASTIAKPIDKQLGVISRRKSLA
jgi:hypothetical protein